MPALFCRQLNSRKTNFKGATSCISLCSIRTVWSIQFGQFVFDLVWPVVSSTRCFRKRQSSTKSTFPVQVGIDWGNASVEIECCLVWKRIRSSPNPVKDKGIIKKAMDGKQDRRKRDCISGPPWPVQRSREKGNHCHSQHSTVDCAQARI